MTTHTGKDGVVEVGANEVAEVTDFTVTETADTVEDHAKGDTAKTHLTTFTSWTAEVSCHWDPSDTNGQEALTIGASVTLSLYPDDNQNGDRKLSGTATVTGITTESPLEGLVSRRLSLQGNGALTASTVSA